MRCFWIVRYSLGPGSSDRKLSKASTVLHHVLLVLSLSMPSQRWAEKGGEGVRKGGEGARKGGRGGPKRGGPKRGARGGPKRRARGAEKAGEGGRKGG